MIPCFTFHTGSSFAGKPPRSSGAGSSIPSSTSGSEANLLSPTENASKAGSVDSSQGPAGQGQNGALPWSSSQVSSRQNSGNPGASDSHNSGGLWLGSKRSPGRALVCCLEAKSEVEFTFGAWFSYPVALEIFIGELL
jgi:hypothetical protein